MPANLLPCADEIHEGYVNRFSILGQPTSKIYTLSLHDALPISETLRFFLLATHYRRPIDYSEERLDEVRRGLDRSEEHTSELQSRFDLVCRLLLEKKKSRNKVD